MSEPMKERSFNSLRLRSNAPNRRTDRGCFRWFRRADILSDATRN